MEEIHEVVERNPIERVLRQRGVLLTGCQSCGNDLRGKCFVCGAADLHVSLKRQVWHCFACHRGGDVIGAVRELDKCSFAEAVEKLKCSAEDSLKAS